MATPQPPLPPPAATAIEADQQQQQQKQQQQQQQQMKKRFRGGFSTSISHLFVDYREKNDCCAFACCGLLLHDRNEYLLMKAQGKIGRDGWSRVACFIGLPLTLVFVMAFLKGVIVGEQVRLHQSTKASPSNTDDDTEAALEGVAWDIAIFASVITMSIALCCLSASEQVRNRKGLLVLMERDGIDLTSPTDTEAQRSFERAQIENDTCAAHSWCCCGCYKEDFTGYTAVNPNNHQQGRSGNENENDEGDEGDYTDMCTCIYSTFNKIFCLAACNTHCLCCGICGLAQEDRQLRAMLPKQDFQMDYITHEPYAAYFGRIQQLRAMRGTHFKLHTQFATSELTKKLCKILLGILLTLTITAVSGLDPNFTFNSLYLVCGTWFQAVAVIYFVHWRKHKFDLSFDAAVKYFASGFCLTVFLAVTYELVVELGFGYIENQIMSIGVAGEEDPLSDDFVRQDQRLKTKYILEHLGFDSVVAFLNAFVVAALIEELAKYFGYWMVETPDLMDPEELIEPANSATAQDHLVLTQEAGMPVPSTPPSQVTFKDPPRSFVSRGAATTVAMVAVATGFACAENFQYVFSTPGGTKNQLSTLLMRSLFPVHPLSAAIQSIGVVKRDLEGQSRNVRLGRILFPAILLHGLFDFILMFMGYVIEHNKFEAEGGHLDDDGEKYRNPLADDDDDSLTPTGIATLGAAFGCVIAAVVYYVHESNAQRQRLAMMDHNDMRLHTTS